MAAAGLFNKPLFISSEERICIECIETLDELYEFYILKQHADVDTRLIWILSYTYMYCNQQHTKVKYVDFWKSVDQLGLHRKFVPNGVLIYKIPTDVQDYYLASDLHEEPISLENHDALFMENPYFPRNTVVDASDPAQDCIRQEMVKCLQMMKGKLNFTDVQIVNGLQILRNRGEEITFMSLLNTLVSTENGLLNVYVGTGKFAFSSDIKLVLRHCYAEYHREPTQEEFELEWNRIKEHLIEQVDVEKARADRTEEEKLEALKREAMLEEEKMRAEEEKMRAEEEKLEALKREAMLEEEKMRAEEEKLKALRDYNTAIEVRNEAVDEIIQGLNREEVLKKEKEEERAKAEAERAKAEMLEKELAKMTALFEKEKNQLLLQIQQMTGCVRA